MSVPLTADSSVSRHPFRDGLGDRVPVTDGAGGRLQLVPAFARFHAHGVGLTHGALAPERVVVAPNGRLWITDSVFGSALERLGLPRRALWQTFRVAAPPAGGPGRP